MRFALSLPEVVEAPHFHYSSFRVRGKIFVTVPPEHTHIHVFLPEPIREQCLALHPEFCEKLHWGPRVLGLRVELAPAPAAVVKAWVRLAWAAKAPKQILKTLGEAG